MEELPIVSYKPTSKRFAAIRHREVQKLRKQLWDIYKTKTKVLVYDKAPHEQLFISGIKMVRLVRKDEDDIYYCIDTNYEEYYEIGLPYVLQCLINEAEKLEDFDEDKYRKAQEAREHNSEMD